MIMILRMYAGPLTQFREKASERNADGGCDPLMAWQSWRCIHGVAVNLQSIIWLIAFEMMEMLAMIKPVHFHILMRPVLKFDQTST